MRTFGNGCWEHTIRMNGCAITLRIQVDDGNTAGIDVTAKPDRSVKQEIDYENSRFIRGVVQLMQTRLEWEGEPTELFSEVLAIMKGRLEINLASESSKVLNKHKQRLFDSERILVSRRRSNGRRYIRLSKAEKS